MNWRRLLGAGALVMMLAACGEKDGEGTTPKDLECGAAETMCGGACADTTTDPRHCGQCETACDTDEVCSAGLCASNCPGGQTACDGGCFTLNDTREHCGACGNTCSPAAICADGDCEALCPDGQSVCDDGCATLATSATNCGACGNACAAGEVCTAGSCEAQCPPGQDACGGGCYDLLIAPEHCGACGTTCAAGELCVDGACALSCATDRTECDGSCVDPESDRAHCGGCDNACSNDQVCVDGACERFCATGTTECDDACRDTNADRNHCGGCGIACGNGESCELGACVPACNSFATTVCDGACTNTDVDPANCGACGLACEAGEVCDAGECASSCSETMATCGGSCTQVLHDPAHCGACDNACPSATNATPVCGMAGCTGVCMAGYGDCNADLDASASDGCETPLDSDTNNCGGCGIVCPTPESAVATCQAGVCGTGTCSPGFGDCDASAATGCEADFSRNDLHCGACGNACPAGHGCVDSACVPFGLGDNCSNPFELSNGGNYIQWEAASQDYLRTSPSCSTSNYPPLGPDIVLRYQAATTGDVEFFVPKPGNTRWHFVVSTGACGTLTPEAACVSEFTLPYATTTIAVTAGTDYFFYVADTTSGTLPLGNPLEMVITEGSCTGFAGKAALLSPANGSTANMSNPSLRVVFDAPVDKTVGTVSVTGNLGTNLSFPLSGTEVTFDAPGRVMTVTPGVVFPSGEQLTVALAGVLETKCNGPVTPPVWSFGIPDCNVLPPPTVVSQTPANGATAHSPAHEILATFSRPADVAGATVDLTGSLGTTFSYTLPHAAVVMSTDSLSMTITPTGKFLPMEQVTVSWSGITDTTCSALLAPPPWTYTNPMPPCTPGSAGMVGSTITRMPTSIFGSTTEYYMAADGDANGYVYVGGSSFLYRMPKAGGLTEDAGAMAGVGTAHLGYAMLIDGPNIYTADSKTGGTDGHLYRISADGGVTWKIEDVATFPSVPADDIHGLWAQGGRVFMITNENAATVDTQIWSVDPSSPSLATLEVEFDAYKYCSSLAVDAHDFYTACRVGTSGTVYAILRIDRSSGEVTEVTKDFPGSPTQMVLVGKDHDGDGRFDFLYFNGGGEDAYYVCQPGTAPYAEQLFSYGSGTGNYGLALEPASNVLWTWNDELPELLKVE